MHPLSTVIYASATARIGLWRCALDHPRFANTGPILSGHLIVFPRTAVRILLPRQEPIIAAPNTVLFYNLYQDYRREPLAADGDRCEWFAFAPPLLAAALEPYEQNALTDPTQPFRFAHAPSPAQLYLQQRLLVDAVLRATQAGEAPDQLWLEEAMLLLLDGVIAHAYAVQRQWGCGGHPQTRQRQQAIVRAVQEQLVHSFTEAPTLTVLAAACHLSPYELCRLFRAYTGTTIHTYLTQLRLHTALEWLADGAADLTTLAFALGFSSHSHFTSAFRRAFGLPPSAWRQQPGLLQKMRKNLIV